MILLTAWMVPASILLFVRWGSPWRWVACVFLATLLPLWAWEIFWPALIAAFGLILAAVSDLRVRVHNCRSHGARGGEAVLMVLGLERVRWPR